MNPRLNYATAAVGFLISVTIISAIAGNNGERRFHSQPEPAVSHQPVFDNAVVFPADTPKLIYPIQDGQNAQGGNNPFDLTPSNVQDSVAYDPESNQYVLIRTLGNQFYGDPTYMSFEEYLDYQSQQQNQNYFAQKADEGSLLDRRGTVPTVNVNSQIADRLFGGTNVDIRPQGNIELTFGANFTNIQNPSLTEQQRKQGGFNFDMNIQMNVVGKIGEKLKLTTNYNTQGQFDFEKQVKLEYTGFPDEIIKKIEAGNVSFPLTTSLITGSQSLFGLKTQLQFGRLMVTSVLSEQKSQTQNITVQGGK
ncbi:MAG TPA: cell surface protein SprA, partial [Chitinophagales bacterium]|nr:cell surface protein SprA [Chitinophagales bacterium]